MVSIKHEDSSYRYLDACISANSDSGTGALSRQFSLFVFGFSGQPSGFHSVASLMTNTTKEYQRRYHFNIPYCTWANRSVENLGTEKLEIGKSLFSRGKLYVLQGPSIIKAIQDFIDQTFIIEPEKYEQRSALCPWNCLTIYRISADT